MEYDHINITGPVWDMHINIYPPLDITRTHLHFRTSQPGLLKQLVDAYDKHHGCSISIGLGGRGSFYGNIDEYIIHQTDRIELEIRAIGTLDTKEAVNAINSPDC